MSTMTHTSFLPTRPAHAGNLIERAREAIAAGIARRKNHVREQRDLTADGGPRMHRVKPGVVYMRFHA